MTMIHAYALNRGGKGVGLQTPVDGLVSGLSAIQILRYYVGRQCWRSPIGSMELVQVDSCAMSRRLMCARPVSIVNS